MDTFSAQLAAARTAAGLSLRGLAGAAHVSPSHVGDLETGRRQPSRQVATALDRALHAGGALADQAPAPMVRSAGVPRATPDLLGHLITVLAGLRALDDQAGAAAVAPMTTAPLRLVTALVRDTTGPTLAPLLTLAQQWTQFAGWLQIATGRWASAGRWLHTTTDWAEQAGDRDMVATAASYRGHLAWLRGHPDVALTHTRVALADPGVHPGQRAYDAHQLVRALAATGEQRAARSALDQADDLTSLALASEAPLPAWQYYRDAAQYRMERGLAGLALAVADPRAAAAAERDLAAGLAGVPVMWQAADWYAEYVAWHGAALAAAGDRVGALAELERARGVAVAAGSRRVVRLVARVERGIPS